MELLRWGLEVTVPNPEHRSKIGQLIDMYVDAREKAAARAELKGRSVIKPPPPPPQFPELIIDALPPLREWDNWGLG